MRKISRWLRRLETTRSNSRRGRPDLNRFSCRRIRFLGPLLAVFATFLLGTSCQPDTAPVAIGDDVAFTVPDPLLIPEGIAFDAVTGDFFVGSTYRRKVVRISERTSVTDFVQTAQDGLWGIVGMRVDPVRRILWLASSHAGDGMPMVDMIPGDEGSAGLFGYHVDTGELLHNHVLRDGEHFLNDVAIGQNGVVYVTDSQSRMVYRFDPSASVFELFADLSQYGGGPNGIDITEDGQSLYVAVGRGIVRVDLSNAAVTVVLTSEDGSSVIDGLYVYRDDLLGVTPFGDDAQVIRFRLGGQPTAVVSVAGVLGEQPLLEQPTTGALVGDSLFLVANSHLQTFRRAWSPAGPDTLGVGLRGLSVLRIRLPNS